MNKPANRNLGPYLVLILAMAIVPVAVAGVTGLWVLTALSIGFFFGFFLQKGDLCGASAFSEVVIMKDGRKVWGLWVAIVASMLGFAVLDWLGLAKLNPKPTWWLSYPIGGAIFGVGTVLAGGCVSGCLFKAGSGNLNSLAALPGIMFGVALVEHGPLHDFNMYLRTFKTTVTGGGPITFSSLTGLSFGMVALILCAVTAVAGFLFRRRGNTVSASTIEAAESTPALGRTLTRPWRPWHSGLAIGLLGALAFLSSASSGRNYPLGVTHGVLHTGLLITDTNLKHVYKKKAAPAAKPAVPAAATPAKPKAASKPKKVVWWLILSVTSLMGGAWVAGRLSGETKLLPKPPEQVLIAFFGGILVGVGAGIAKGCVVGNIISGLGLMSAGLLLFVLTMVLANWITTWLYLMGGSFHSRSR